MKKPINKFSVALWVLAVAILACDLAQIDTLLTSAQIWNDIPWGMAMDMVQKLFGAALAASAQVAGLGMIIELLDQIRWNSLQQTRT